MKGTACRLLAIVLLALYRTPALAEEIPRLLLSVEGGSFTVVLEDHSAARSLLAQLPLTLAFEDYNGTEKIAYLPEALDLSDGPDGCDPEVGTLAYYAPWGNLCIFYRDFRYSDGLVPLGRLEGETEGLASLEEDFNAVLQAVRVTDGADASTELSAAEAGSAAALATEAAQPVDAVMSERKTVPAQALPQSRPVSPGTTP